ncbi:hypothetical protein BbiDN127_NXAF0107 (plasmid) [Borreliella bissettiae DN127]|uniref:Uncharacterized protein n=1 Tax=Borrelia bissettiae (strain DSM 17990 / CIP 109136 / DN127) TaxID=521010 RepID=G0ANW3_BORBD|nr:hypothetical protein BbiDN127_NXAF0107 [Borreliella bissettiae DN127]
MLIKSIYFISKSFLAFLKKHLIRFFFLKKSNLWANQPKFVLKFV